MKIPISDQEWDEYEINGYRLSHLLRIAEFCEQSGFTPMGLFKMMKQMDELQAFIETEQTKLKHDILRRLLTHDRP